MTVGYFRRIALHLGVFGSHKSIVEYLLSVGDVEAQLNYEDDEANTPLHIAASTNLIEIAKVLLAHGAKKISKNQYGEIPFDLARSDEMRTLLSPLPGIQQKPVLDKNYDLWDCCEIGAVEILKLKIVEFENKPWKVNTQGSWKRLKKFFYNFFK